MPIICLFGPDGSGKSTLAQILAKRLNNNDFRVKLSWMRGTHTLASLTAQLLSKFPAFKGSDNPYYKMTIPRNLKRLWQFIEFASSLPIILFKFILPSTLDSWVIAERYAPDFVAWVSLTTSDQDYLESVEAKFMLALSSRANAKIYVTASLGELLKRREGVNPAYMGDQLKLYDKIALAISAKRLDTTRESVNKSLEEILVLLDMQQTPTKVQCVAGAA